MILNTERKREKKKIINKIIICITILLIFIINIPVKASTTQILKGDINKDNKVDTADLLSVLRHIASTKTNKREEWKLSEEKKKIADINDDNKVDITDVLGYYRYIAANKNENIHQKHPEWMDKIRLKKLELKKEQINLQVGESEKLEILTENIENIKYQSTNKTIADVNENGVITAKQEGETQVTIIANDILNLQCQVSVQKKEETIIKIEDIILEKTQVELNLEETKTTKIGVTIKPENATNQTLIWESRNPEIASVDEQGTVTAQKEGETDVIVKTTDGSNLTKTCHIMVKGKIIPPIEPIKVSHIILNRNNEEIDLAQSNPTVNLIATVYPSNADNKEVQWESSNPEIATVSQNGLVTGIKEGECTITVKSKENNNITATCQIRVTKTEMPVEPVKVSNITLNTNQEEIDLTKTNKTVNLIATVYPSNADNKEVQWESSNPEIATVNQTGLVTGIKEGECIITVKSKENTNIKATCEINVIKGLKITASSNEYLDVTNASKKLTATQIGNQTTETINWKIKDSTIATISSTTGNSITVTRKKAGNTIITASSASGKSVEYEIGVKQEKVIYTGASGTELMARERKDGDTGIVQNIDYGTLQKNKDLFFIVKSGAGILWYLSDAERESILSNANYYSQTYKASIPCANTKIEELINAEDLSKVHISVAFCIEGNDIRRAKGVEEHLLNQATLYGDYLKKISKKYPQVDFYAISKGAYHPDTTQASYNENCRTFNKKLTEIINESALSNLQYKPFFVYSRDLWASDSKTGVTADGHPNEYTTQKFFDKILDFIKIDANEDRSEIVVNTKTISQRNYKIIADNMLKNKMNTTSYMTKNDK